MFVVVVCHQCVCSRHSRDGGHGEERFWRRGRAWRRPENTFSLRFCAKLWDCGVRTTNNSSAIRFKHSVHLQSCHRGIFVLCCLVLFAECVLMYVIVLLRGWNREEPYCWDRRKSGTSLSVGKLRLVCKIFLWVFQYIFESLKAFLIELHCCDKWKIYFLLDYISI